MNLSVNNCLYTINNEVNNEIINTHHYFWFKWAFSIAITAGFLALFLPPSNLVSSSCWCSLGLWIFSSAALISLLSFSSKSLNLYSFSCLAFRIDNLFFILAAASFSSNSILCCTLPGPWAYFMLFRSMNFFFTIPALPSFVYRFIYSYAIKFYLE